MRSPWLTGCFYKEGQAVGLEPTDSGNKGCAMWLFFRGDNKKLKARNTQLTQRLETAKGRLNELEDQHSQQGLLQEKMRDRIKQMDEHAQHSSQQVD